IQRRRGRAMAQIEEAQLDNILLAESAAPEGEVVFMSLDEVGAPGRLNRAVLSHFDLGDAFLPDPEDLSGGYAIKTAGEQTIVFSASFDPGFRAFSTTPAVDALLVLAERLRRVRTSESNRISTTILFFALGQSGTSPPLQSDPAAGAFRVALQELAGERYQAAFESEFNAGQLAELGPIAELPLPTPN